MSNSEHKTIVADVIFLTDATSHAYPKVKVKRIKICVKCPRTFLRGTLFDPPRFPSFSIHWWPIANLSRSHTTSILRAHFTRGDRFDKLARWNDDNVRGRIPDFWHLVTDLLEC